MARATPIIRKPFKQSRADSLMQAFDDSLAAHGYVSTGPKPIAPKQSGYADAGASVPGPTTGQMAAQERMYQEGLKRQKNAARKFIQKNPTTSI